MKVILKTLCGCTREIDMCWRGGVVQKIIRVPLELPCTENKINYISNICREFKYNGGINSSGTPIYVEIYKGN